MRISYNPQLYNPKFTDSYREKISSVDGSLEYRTQSYLFREDLDWEKFSQLLMNKYDGVPKVNVICHACSDGSEPYSLIMKLVTDWGDKADKFFPIIAKDIDEQNIKEANSDKFSTGLLRYGFIKVHTKNNMEKFLKEGDAPINFHSPVTLYPTPLLKSKVQFSKGDILEDVDNLPEKDTVLMLRNIWPYLKTEDRDKLVNKLSQKFDSSCLLVIGDYDKTESEVEYLLFKYGFVETTVQNVYQKRIDLGKNSTLNSIKMGINYDNV